MGLFFPPRLIPDPDVGTTACHQDKCLGFADPFPSGLQWAGL